MSDKKIIIYPLLALGYGIENCPTCKKECYPDFLLKNGKLRYNIHKCTGKYSSFAVEPEFIVKILKKN